MSNTLKLPTCPKCGAPIPIEAPQGLCPKCVLLGAATATEQGVPATATSEIPSIERIAEAFPQLEILELLGRGGMGFVFKARQPHLDRFVALKLLPDKLAKDPQFAERFNREGRVLAKLNHPNIVSVFDFGQAGGFYYLSMEYVDGVNLRQAMRAGRFSPAEALSIVPKVCEALQYAHEQGILHRDIKPENILLDAKGRVKIADFGIAKLVGEDQPNITLTNTGAALGTPHYMAPEQLEKPATVDHRADIYSLGVVFYEMLTGELPIGRFAAPSSKTPVNTTVDDVVFRTLEKDRERRFQSAGEMKTQVEHLGAGARDTSSFVEAEVPASVAPATVILEKVLQVVFSGLLLFCLFAFLSFEQRDITSEGQHRTSVLVGWPDPWLVINQPQLNGAVRTSLNFGAGSMLFALGAVGGGGMIVWLRRRANQAAATFRHARLGVSHWSIYGAISVGLSLPGPFGAIVAMLGSRGEIGPRELWLALGSVAMPGIGGTLLGWLALNEIRESRGRVKGLPLALFATLFWPLTIFVALTVGVPMFWRVPGGEPTTSFMIGRFLVLLLPAAVIAFGFWAIHATARWASQQQVTGQRGLLKWAFIVVLVVGMGVVLVTNPGRHRSGSLLPAQSGKFVALSDAKAKVVEFSRIVSRTDSILLTTTSLLGPNEALVPIFERPDGSREMGHLITTLSRENNQRRESATAIWNWSQNGGYPPEETERIETLLKENVAGRPLTLVAGQPLHLFSITNQAGGVLRCHLDYQPDFAENAYRSTESDQAMVRVEQGIVSSGSSSTLILFLKPSIPPGHSLQPICDGTIGSSGSTQRSISQSPGNASFTCNWAFPASFTSNDVFTAQAQCEKLGQSPPFAIPSGGRQLLFAVTNQAGEIHRGYLELVKPNTPPASTSSTDKPEASTEVWSRKLAEIAAVSARTNLSERLQEMKHPADERRFQEALRSLAPSPKSKMIPSEAGLMSPDLIAASAELWSPKLAPGEKPNVSEILQEAKRLTDAGSYEEALQRHIWYHNHALEIQPSQVGVRLSFALSYWAELAQRYPKAKEALNEISDRGTQAFAQGEGRFDRFMEISSINSQLGRQKETLALFESIQSQDPKLARQCYGSVENLLVEKGDYALCESFIPDFQKRFETLRSAWQRTLSDRNPEANRDSLRQHAQRTFVKDTRKLVEILVGVSRNTEAEALRDQAVAMLDVPDLRSAMTDAEQKAAKHSVVPKKP